MLSITDGCSTKTVELDRVDKIYVVINHDGAFFAPYTVVTLHGELGELKGQVVLTGQKGAIIVVPALDKRVYVPYNEETNNEVV